MLVCHKFIYLFIYRIEFKSCGIFIFLKAKMHFWSLDFELVLDLVPKLIFLLVQSMILEYRFYFGLCRQPNNKKIIRGRRSTLLAC